MPKIIENIIKEAVNAPSGHNSQPWRFLVKGEELFIWNIPEKDKILFNYEERGSLVANGALIENIYIIASKYGYETESILYPDKTDSDLIARLTFREKRSDYKYESLYRFIFTRTTNRRPFVVTPLKDEHRVAINKFIESLGIDQNKIVYTEDRSKIKEVSWPFSVGDRLLFENKYIHHDLFSNVNWTLREEESKREGLYVMTKELSLFGRFVFKYLLSNWNVLSKLNKAQFSIKAGEKRADLYQHCSAIGLIVSNGNTPKEFVESGRLIQRFWLTATSLGLSFQPVSIGLLYLGQWCQKESPERLSENQIKLVKEAYDKIINIFKVDYFTPTFSFRIGYSKPPTASSLKKIPIISYDK